MNADQFAIYCFRDSPIEQDLTALDPAVEDETEEEPSDEKEYLLCANCHEIITSSSERILIEGVHRHTFANPHGIIFEIGCFRVVQGCNYEGPAMDDFSWFKGYSWKIAYCRKCALHLGWLFVSTGADQFNGLILDRLVESDKEGYR